MKHCWPIGLALLLGACGSLWEGFEHPVVETTVVQVGQGQSCVSGLADLRLTIKYPHRLPVGVGVRALANGQFQLVASVEAPKNQVGMVSNGLRVVVSEPTATLTANCDTNSMLI